MRETGRLTGLAVSTAKVGKDLTVMVFMAGENNLREDMVTGMREIKAVGNESDDLNLLARFESGSPSVPTGYFVFEPSGKEKTLAKCRVQDEIVLGKTGKNEGNQIVEFVSWAKQNFPAKRYILILSGHGVAFRGKTFLQGNSSGALALGDLKKRLSEINEILGGKLAILGFDCCAMNLLEIADELKDYAKYLVGSEGFTPKSGWAYTNSLRELARNPQVSTAEAARIFGVEFAKQNYDYCLAGRSVEISVVNLNNLRSEKSVVKALFDLARTLSVIFPKDVPLNSEEVFSREHFAKLITFAHWKAQTFFFDQNVDLFDFAAILREECRKSHRHISAICGNAERENAKSLFHQLEEVANKCGAVIETESDFVVNSSFTGPDYRYSRGTSIFFPWSYQSLSAVREIYGEFLRDETDETPWMEFLERFTLATMRGNEPQNSLGLEATHNLIVQPFVFDTNELKPEFSKRIIEPWKFAESSKEVTDLANLFHCRFKNYADEWDAHKF